MKVFMDQTQLEMIYGIIRLEDMFEQFILQRIEVLLQALMTTTSITYQTQENYQKELKTEGEVTCVCVSKTG